MGVGFRSSVAPDCCNHWVRHWDCTSRLGKELAITTKVGTDTSLTHRPITRIEITLEVDLGQVRGLDVHPDPIVQVVELDPELDHRAETDTERIDLGQDTATELDPMMVIDLELDPRTDIFSTLHPRIDIDRHLDPGMSSGIRLDIGTPTNRDLDQGREI